MLFFTSKIAMVQSSAVDYFTSNIIVFSIKSRKHKTSQSCAVREGRQQSQHRFSWCLKYSVARPVKERANQQQTAAARQRTVVFESNLMEINSCSTFL